MAELLAVVLDLALALQPHPNLSCGFFKTDQLHLAAAADVAQAQNSANGTWSDQAGPNPGQLYGVPVTYVNGLPSARDIDAAGTATSTGIAIVADMDEFVMVRHPAGAILELVPHVFGSNGRPQGTRGLYMAWRFTSKLTMIGAASHAVDHHRGLGVRPCAASRKARPLPLFLSGSAPGVPTPAM